MIVRCIVLCQLFENIVCVFVLGKGDCEICCTLKERVGRIPQEQCSVLS